MTPGIRDAHEGTPHRGIVPVPDYEAAWDSQWSGSTSLEKALDQATERYSLAIQRRVAARHAESQSSQTTALTLASAPTGSALVAITRLRWRGMDVSDEFQRYAARVARGEVLAPYRGQVLARPCVDFPWGAEGRVEATMPLPRRSALKAGWLAGLGSLLAVLGLGGTVTAISGDDAASLPPAWSVPAPSPERSVEAPPGPYFAIATPAPPVASLPAALTATSATRAGRKNPQRTSARAARLAIHDVSAAPLDAHTKLQAPERTLPAAQADVARAPASGDSGTAATSSLLLEVPPF
jgi:hypothetical protein